MKIADGELHQILLHDLKLSAATVRELVADSRQSQQLLLKVVLHSYLASDKQIALAHAKRLGVPFVDLTTAHIADSTLRRLPHPIAAQYNVVCFDETPTSVKVAMADPRNEPARKALRDYYGKTVRRYLTTDRGLTAAMRTYRKQDSSPLPFSTRDLLATILDQASRNGSTTLHFEPRDNSLIIKRRVGKELRTLATLPIQRYRALISWCKTQSGNDVGDSQRPHHGKFSITIDGLLHDVILSTLPTVNGEKMTLRLIPPSDSIPSLKQIGFGPKDTAYLEQIIKDGRGLVIVAGGNGSEVPSTLASLALVATKQPNTMVSTIEEPLCYHIPKASQIEVTHALPFSDIVGAVVAQNPNIIAVSDLGKGTVAEQLVDFSLSQHLVMSGLYGTSLNNVITKLMSYPMAPALMAASLRLIIVQHQLPALCRHCRTSFAPSGPLKKALWQQFGFTQEAHLYRKGPGCSYCENGIHGTVLATEWLPTSQELQQLIATNADSTSLKELITNKSDYIIHLGKLAARGAISIDEATQRVASAQ